MKLISVLILFISLQLQAQYPGEFVSIIHQPYSNTPLFLVDKNSWQELSTIEQQNLIHFVQGSGYGNGGHLLNCENKPPVILDYFEATLPNLSGVSNFIDIDQIKVIDHFKKIFSPFAEIKEKFEHALKIIGDPSTWIASDIKSSFDSKQAYYINDFQCNEAKIQQIAIRQNYTVYIDRELFNTLSTSQQELLYIHEVLYYLGEKYNNINNSILVRQIIRQALTPDQSILTTEKIRILLQDLIGKPVFYHPQWGAVSNLKQLIEHLATPIFSLTSFTKGSKYYHCLATQENNNQNIQIDFSLVDDLKIQLFSSNSLYNKKGSFETKFIPNPSIIADLGSYHMTFYKTFSDQILIKIHWPVSRRTLYGICL